MSRQDNFWVLIDHLDKPKRTTNQVAADIAAALRAGSSPRLCAALAEMIDPKGRPYVGFRLKLQRVGRGRPKADPRIGMAMARLVDDEDQTVDQAVYQAQKEFGKKGNSRSTLMAALKSERDLRHVAALVDKANKRSPK